LQDVRHCGYPDRLLLPKGKRDGMAFSLFVILSDFDKEKVSSKVLTLSIPPTIYIVPNVVLVV
jgi:hypothetical protein